MNTTLFLASLWGPIVLAGGIGIFVSKSYYEKVYRDLEKETLAVMVFGMMAMAIGIVQVSVHNYWGSLSEIVISILGWGALLKGTLFTIAPKIVDSAGDWAVKSKIIPITGVLMIVFGLYLSWIAYLA